MMLMGVEAKVSLSAVIDVAESAVQSMALPFGRKHGPLISNYLASAKNWCTVDKGSGNILFGIEAAKDMMISIIKGSGGVKGEGTADSKVVMALAPYVQLLDDEQQKLLRKQIEKLADAAPGGTKRLGSRLSLGLLKSKKIVAKASVSSGSGASLNIDLFDV